MQSNVCFPSSSSSSSSSHKRTREDNEDKTDSAKRLRPESPYATVDRLYRNGVSCKWVMTDDERTTLAKNAFAAVRKMRVALHSTLSKLRHIAFYVVKSRCSVCRRHTENCTTPRLEKIYELFEAHCSYPFLFWKCKFEGCSFQVCGRHAAVSMGHHSGFHSVRCATHNEFLFASGFYRNRNPCWTHRYEHFLRVGYYGDNVGFFSFISLVIQRLWKTRCARKRKALAKHRLMKVQEMLDGTVHADVVKYVMFPYDTDTRLIAHS
jgi:hypothetical protein